MAIYNNLPVYKVSYDLLILTFKEVKTFEREYKHTLWNEIKKEIINLIKNIYKANTKLDKADNIERSIESLEILRLYFRVAKDVHLLKINKFIEINLLIESISKQLSSWLKYFTLKQN